VVVNEASCCGCAVAASDHVGAARDLILPIHPDFIYPCGDVEALTQLLQKAVSNRSTLAERGQTARRHMESWGPQENISAMFEAIQLGASRVGRRVVADSPSLALNSSATPLSGNAKERSSR
jgi:glycosyltransferase involved in cell wall biosynthesis